MDQDSLDAFIRNMVLREARERQNSYEAVGVQAYLRSSRTLRAKTKPKNLNINKRFLSNMIVNTDGHNSRIERRLKRKKISPGDPTVTLSDEEESASDMDLSDGDDDEAEYQNSDTECSKSYPSAPSDPPISYSHIPPPPPLSDDSQLFVPPPPPRIDSASLPPPPNDDPLQYYIPPPPPITQSAFIPSPPAPINDDLPLPTPKSTFKHAHISNKTPSIPIQSSKDNADSSSNKSKRKLQISGLAGIQRYLKPKPKPLDEDSYFYDE